MAGAPASFLTGLFLILTSGAAEAVSLSTSTLQWGGYFTLRHEESSSQTPKNSIERAFMTAAFQASPKISIAARIRMDEWKGVRNRLNLAQIEYKPGPAWQISAGQIILPLSREATIFSPYLDFMNRAYGVSRLFIQEPEGADIGIKTQARLKNWEAQLALINGSGPNVKDDPPSKPIAARLGLEMTDFGFATYGYAGEARLSNDSSLAAKQRYGGEFRFGTTQQNLRVEIHRGEDGDRKSRGWFVQADTPLGIFSVEAYQKLEWLQRLRPMIRLESYDPDIQTPNNKIIIASIIFHYYIHTRCRVGIQWDDRREEDLLNQISDNSFSAQIQLSL